MISLGRYGYHKDDIAELEEKAKGGLLKAGEEFYLANMKREVAEYEAANPDVLTDAPSEQGEPASLEESKRFDGVPSEMHKRGFPKVLATAVGFTAGQDTSQMGLADIAISAFKSDEQWHVFVFDPKNPPSNPNDVFGSFTDNDMSLTGADILDKAETWIRDSESTEWVPGCVIDVTKPPSEVNALGYLLVRAPLTTRA